MPPKRPASPLESTSAASKIHISESIHDRSSVFIGYYDPDGQKPKELQSRHDVKSASHRILAWRLPSNQKTLLSSSRPIFKTGHDDDGENWAGKKLEKVMEELDVQGAIMVARWYGGELLGPVRFTHIENVAKGAVNTWRGEKHGSTSKKLKLDDHDSQSPISSSSNQTMRPEELQRRKREVIQTLQRRDESVTTLRALLEQKKSNADLKSSQSAATASPNRILTYDQMPFSRLQALENARDMTISFLLKQIDKAEAEATKQADESRKTEEATTARIAKQRAEQDELELDEAWAEMEDAMKQAAAVEKAAAESKQD
jgi:hypothetical protein